MRTIIIAAMLALCALAQTPVQISGYYLSDGTHYYTPATMTLCTRPDLSTFTWINQGGATVSMSGNALLLHAPANSGVSIRALAQSIGTNTTLTVAYLANQVEADYVTTGIAFYESATGRVETLDIGPMHGGVGLGANAYFSTTSFWNFLWGTDAAFPSVMFFRITISNGTLSFYHSMDGRNWSQVYAHAQNAFFQTKPDKWFFFVCQENINYDATGVLLSWKVE
jgi:hypothetical protein